jgi:serine/threonine protein kinase
MAPELIVNDPEEGHSIEVDVWAIGVIIYTLLVGTPPFEDPGKDIKKVYKNIKKCKFEFPEPKIKNVIGISDEAKDLIKLILVRSPKKRLTLEMILRHPWLMNNQGQIPEFLEVQAMDIPPSTKFMNRFKILTAEATLMLTPLERFLRNAMEKQYQILKDKKIAAEKEEEERKLGLKMG